MRIRLFSDLHLEFADFDPPAADCELVVLAGDIHIGLDALPWIREHFDQPVLYVLGNHEYYRQCMPDLRESLELLLSNDPQITLLENRSLRVGDWEFFGCTLWTDYDLLGDAPRCQAIAAHGLSDYRLIARDAEGRRLEPADTIEFHHRSRAWLAEAVAASEAPRKVVVSHHAPSARSLDPDHQSEALSAAYASRLEDFVAGLGVAAWLHGHTHCAADYRLGDTRVLANQRGYHPFDPARGFSLEGVFEL